MLSLSGFSCMHGSSNLTQLIAHVPSSAQPAAMLESICENPEFCNGRGGGYCKRDKWNYFAYTNQDNKQMN